MNSWADFVRRLLLAIIAPVWLIWEAPFFLYEGLMSEDTDLLLAGFTETASDVVDSWMALDNEDVRPTPFTPGHDGFPISGRTTEQLDIEDPVVTVDSNSSNSVLGTPLLLQKGMSSIGLSVVAGDAGAVGVDCVAGAVGVQLESVGGVKPSSFLIGFGFSPLLTPGIVLEGKPCFSAAEAPEIVRCMQGVCQNAKETSMMLSTI